jgi:hypothetical protein
VCTSVNNNNLYQTHRLNALDPAASKRNTSSVDSTEIDKKAVNFCCLYDLEQRTGTQQHEKYEAVVQLHHKFVDGISLIGCTTTFNCHGFGRVHIQVIKVNRDQTSLGGVVLVLVADGHPTDCLCAHYYFRQSADPSQYNSTITCGDWSHWLDARGK